MCTKQTLSLLLTGVVFLIPQNPLAGNTKISEEYIQGVERTPIDSDERKQQRRQVAAMLTEYEIEAKRLTGGLDKEADREKIDRQAESLISLSGNIVDWARFRLTQCDDYLNRSLELKSRLSDISREALERDYHRDGALPKAPAECYHIKDMFVHPATVLVLTRDDPGLSRETITNIRAEMMEVLGHTEAVRQLVIY